MKEAAVAVAPERLKDKQYEKELRKLQAELCHLQAWVKHRGLRIVIVFEGRDAAGQAACGRIPTTFERRSVRGNR